MSLIFEIWCQDMGLVSWGRRGDAPPWELLSFEQLGTSAFRRGDANADGSIDISDPIATLQTLFLGQGPLPCSDAADADDDGKLNLTDAIFTLSFLFRDPALTLPAPGPETCDFDPTDDELDCASFAPCV